MPAFAHDLRLGALKAAYADGSLTPRQLILALRDQAAALNPEFNLFIHLLSVEELEPYLAALDGKSAAELPLFGVPFAIKDNIDLAGIPTPPPARPSPMYRSRTRPSSSS